MLRLNRQLFRRVFARLLPPRATNRLPPARRRRSSLGVMTLEDRSLPGSVAEVLVAAVLGGVASEPIVAVTGALGDDAFASPLGAADEGGIFVASSAADGTAIEAAGFALAGSDEPVDSEGSASPLSVGIDPPPSTDPFDDLLPDGVGLLPWNGVAVDLTPPIGGGGATDLTPPIGGGGDDSGGVGSGSPGSDLSAASNPVADFWANFGPGSSSPASNAASFAPSGLDAAIQPVSFADSGEEGAGGLALMSFGMGSTDVVVSQVYAGAGFAGGGSGGSGGSGGAAYNRDFVELFNRSDAPVSVSGWSVQYRTPFSGGGLWQTTLLTGTINPGQYYLVGQAFGGSGAPLPTPDANGSLDLDGTGGAVAVVRSTAPLPPSGGGGPIADLVGFGAGGAPTAEMSPVGVLGLATAAIRNDGGYTDTDNNSPDFTVGTPTPRNRLSPPFPLNRAPTATLPGPITVASGGTTTFPASVSDPDAGSAPCW